MFEQLPVPELVPLLAQVAAKARSCFVLRCPPRAMLVLLLVMVLGT
jgi:hypothetical protein